MNSDDAEKISNDARALEALDSAGAQYREYVRLAQLGEFASQQTLERLSYQRDWKHPLGLVINK